MRGFILCICMSGLIASAHAAPVQAVPKGPTVEDLQARVDFLSAALQGARQQRDAALSALADAQLQAAITAQPKPAPSNKQL